MSPPAIGSDTARAPLPSRALHRTIVACAAAMFAPLLVPLVTGTVFTQYDLAWFHLPMRFLYRNALRAGDSILWTPALHSGFFLHGEGQIGMAHPAHLLLYRWLPLATAVNLEILAIYACAFAGMRLLLRRLALSRTAALVGAMLFAFSGFMVLHLNHLNAVAIAANAPWMLWGGELLLRPAAPRDRAWGFAGVAGAFGSQLLLGHPQYVWFALLALAGLVVCRRPAVKEAALLGGALTAGLLIGGVQLVPSVAAVGESSRVMMPFEFRMTFSLHPWNLVQLWSPYAFRLRAYNPEALMVHEFGVYNGAFCTAAVVWLIARLRHLEARRSIALALLVSLAVSLVLALGAYGGLYALVARLPLVGNFRAPARYIMLVHLTLSMIGALVFDDLLSLARARSIGVRLWPLGVMAVATLLTLAAGTVFRDLWPPEFPWSPPPRLAFGTVLVIATLVLMAAGARGRTWAIGSLAALVAFDLGFWGYRYIWQPPPESIAQIPLRVPLPADVRPGDLLVPLIPPADGNYHVLAGFPLGNGYAGFYPPRRAPPADPVGLRLAGARWGQTWERGWERVADPLPRARLVTDARVTTDVWADAHLVDIAQTALVDEAIGPLSGPRGAATVRVDVPGHLAIDVNAGGRQLLVVTERFDEGWQATADARPVRALRVYGDYLGCIVEAGMTRVEFRFSPRSVRLGGWATAAGGAALVGAVVSLRRRDRR